MIAFTTPTEMAAQLARRLRDARLRRGWTQGELARRAGIRPATYVLFERTGKISVLRLLRILEVLGLSAEFDRIGRSEDLAGMTLNQLMSPPRQRGKRGSRP